VLLRENKLNLNESNSQGDTALMFAARLYPNIVALLLDHGAQWISKNSQLQTCLHIAAAQNHDQGSIILNTILTFISGKIPPKEENSSGKTKIHIKTPTENFVNAIHKQKTALHYALESGSKDLPEKISVLLKNNADIRIKSQRGKTTLQLAREIGDSEVKCHCIKLLESEWQRLDNIANESMQLLLPEKDVEQKKGQQPKKKKQPPTQQLHQQPQKQQALEQPIQQQSLDQPTQQEEIEQPKQLRQQLTQQEKSQTPEAQLQQTKQHLHLSQKQQKTQPKKQKQQLKQHQPQQTQEPQTQLQTQQPEKETEIDNQNNLQDQFKTMCHFLNTTYPLVNELDILPKHILGNFLPKQNHW